MELLVNHRSVRSYLSKEIEAKVLSEVLLSGIRTSNTGNMQLYSVVVTKDVQKKELLAPFHFNQPMVNQAPVLLTVCFDINRFYKWCEARNTRTDFKDLLWLLNGTIDASILAQNICIAYKNLGLGICYLGTTLYNAPEISSVLKLPVGVIPITALTVGYPAFIPEISDRLPLEAIVHYEEYNEYSESQIIEIYKDKEALLTSERFVAENGKENLAQVYTEVRYKVSDSEFFTNKLSKFLISQGFSFE